MNIVCTGKGQHRPLKLWEFRDGEMRSGGVHGEVWPYYHRFGYWASMHSEEPVTETQTFSCRRCKRNTELSATKLIAALDGLQSMGESQLDVSLLPF